MNEVKKLIDSIEFMLSDLNSDIDYETQIIVLNQLDATKEYLKTIEDKTL